MAITRRQDERPETYQERSDRMDAQVKATREQQHLDNAKARESQRLADERLKAFYASGRMRRRPCEIDPQGRLS